MHAYVYMHAYMQAYVTWGAPVLLARDSLFPVPGRYRLLRQQSLLHAHAGVRNVESSRPDAYLQDALTPHLLQGSQRSVEYQERLAKVVQLLFWDILYLPTCCAACSQCQLCWCLTNWIMVQRLLYVIDAHIVHRTMQTLGALCKPVLTPRAQWQ